MKRSKNVRRLRVFFAFILLIVGIYCFAFAKQIRCECVSFSSLAKVDELVYLDPKMTIEERRSVLLMVGAAKQRLEAFMGPIQSAPKIIAGLDESVIGRFGQSGSKTAVTHLHFGRAAIVLGPDGINVDVIAHEMLHAELCKRIGWLNRELRLPVWFDEGLAMQVDYRDSYSEAAWQQKSEEGRLAPKMETITSRSKFFDERTWWMNYASSKHEVARWLTVVGHDGLEKLIDSRSKGERFASHYRSLESAKSLGGANEGK